jgi:acyl CoA:acetate/3-ketoacid CoA transferase alpha subunit
MKPEKDIKKMEQGTISIEKLEAGSNAVYFTIFRSKIGTLLYKGMISGALCKYKSIDEKPNRV